MPIVISTPSEFVHQHGDHVTLNSQLYFEDGATASMNMSVRNDPPENDFARLRNRLEYADKKVHDAESEFKQTRTEFSQQAAWAQRSECVIPPPDNATEILLHLKAEVKRWRKLKDEIIAELATTPEFQEIAKREKGSAYQDYLKQQRFKALEINNEIASITLDD